MSDLEKALELHKRALPALALELPREVFDDYLAIALPIDHAARKWASLTSPETIEKAATIIAMQHGYPWPDLKEPYREGFRRRAEAVLHAVEEGET